jgi:hypothetical protein
VIIIEGSDLTGKTTLANLITQQFPSQFAHLGLPPEGKRHWDIVRNELLSNPKNTVYDRMVIGSWVFRQVKPDSRNVNGVTDRELVRWQTLTRKLSNTLVIRAYAPAATLCERMSKRGDEYINTQELLASGQLYARAFAEWAFYDPNAYITYNSYAMDPQWFIDTHRSAIAQALADDSYPSFAEERMIVEAFQA